MVEYKHLASLFGHIYWRSGKPEANAASPATGKKDSSISAFLEVLVYLSPKILYVNHTLIKSFKNLRAKIHIKE